MSGMDSSWLSPLANIAGIIGGLLLLYVGLVRFVPPFQTFLILRPLSWRNARRAGLDRETWRHLRRDAKAHVSGRTTRPGAVLGDLLRMHGDPEHPAPWTPWRTALEKFIGRATAPDSPLLAARFIVPEQVERLDELLHGIAELLARFDRVAPVPRTAALRPTGGGDGVASSTFASALSGAAVLVDAGASRGGAADSILTWAATTYRDDETQRSQRETYEGTRRGLVVDDSSRLGDYDGRLLDLDGVTLAANSSDGEVSFVLETAETSYRATEPPSRLAAKGLAPAAYDESLPVFRVATVQGGRDGDTHATYRRLRTGTPQRPRTVPVTSYVSLMLRSRPVPDVEVHGLEAATRAPVDMLVLCRRSAATRNGSGTLSATAGGVIELDQKAVRLDTDDLGAPDVTGAALREMTEELGISPDEVTAVPAAVFVATLEGPRSRRPGRGSGQVVASALHLGSTAMSLSGLLAARQNASATRGAFEVDSLEAFAMLPGKDGLNAFVTAVRAAADRLDQHGLLSCFYAALRFYPSGIVEAFTEAFEAPWWAIPWTGEEQDGRFRLVRDVRQVMPDDAERIERAVAGWRSSWDALPQRLDREATGGDVGG